MALQNDLRIHYDWVYLKSKNNVNIEIKKALYPIIWQYIKNIDKSTFVVDSFTIPKNIINFSKKDDYNYLSYDFEINGEKYNWYFNKSGVGRVGHAILIGIEGDCWLRQLNMNLHKIDKFTNMWSHELKINDPNLLIAKDEFLFRLPEGLAQYPINDSLNISGQWDFISNVNQWKKEMKEMSSKW